MQIDVIVPASALSVASVQTASFTATANNLYPVDMSAAGADFTVTAPASPSSGDRFGYYLARSSNTYECLFGRNSSNVYGGTDAEPYCLYNAGEYVVWRYDATTSGRGWYLEAKQYIPGYCAMRQDTTQSISHDTATVLTLDSTQSDTGGMANLASDLINVRRKARYRLSALTSFVLEDQRRHITYVQINGSTLWLVATAFTSYGAATVGSYPQGTIFLALNRGDTIKLATGWDYNAGSGSKSTVVSADAGKPRIEVEEVV